MDVENLELMVGAVQRCFVENEASTTLEFLAGQTQTDLLRDTRRGLEWLVPQGQISNTINLHNFCVVTILMALNLNPLTVCNGKWELQRNGSLDPVLCLLHRSSHRGPLHCQ